MRIGTLIVVIWLVIGAIAAGQRGYFSNDDTNCAEIGSIALTIVSGPLNYWFVDPDVSCDAPQPVED